MRFHGGDRWIRTDFACYSVGSNGRTPQMRTVPSIPPEARRVLSGLKASVAILE